MPLKLNGLYARTYTSKFSLTRYSIKIYTLGTEWLWLENNNKHMEVLVNLVSYVLITSAQEQAVESGRNNHIQATREIED